MRAVVELLERPERAGKDPDRLEAALDARDALACEPTSRGGVATCPRGISTRQLRRRRDPSRGISTRQPRWRRDHPPDAEYSRGGRGGAATTRPTRNIHEAAAVAATRIARCRADCRSRSVSPRPFLGISTRRPAASPRLCLRNIHASPRGVAATPSPTNVSASLVRRPSSRARAASAEVAAYGVRRHRVEREHLRSPDLSATTRLSETPVSAGALPPTSPRTIRAAPAASPRRRVPNAPSNR